MMENQQKEKGIFKNFREGGAFSNTDYEIIKSNMFQETF